MGKKKSKVAAVAKEAIEAIDPARRSANTWWCSVCGAGNRIGATPEPVPCGGCGTPHKGV